MKQTTNSHDDITDKKEPESAVEQTEAEKLRADTLNLLKRIISDTMDNFTVANFTCIVRAFSALKSADEMVRTQSAKHPVNKTIPREVIAQIEKDVLGINREPSNTAGECDEQ